MENIMQKPIAVETQKVRMKEAFVLVGPIAAGKSYTGKLLERNFGIPFFEYEDIFVREQRSNPVGYLQRAEPIATRAIFEFLEKNDRMCFENTMARPYAIEILNGLQQVADVRLINVYAPLDLALKRLARRDKSEHVEWKPDELRKIYDKNQSLCLEYDLILNNTDLSEEDIIHSLSLLVRERVWHPTHVEIDFRGHALKFNSWSGANLTPYDWEYKPWRSAFKKENVGYLMHYDLKPGDIVIDAGGYEGTFAIYAAKAIGEEGTVIVFEPDTENYAKLKENVKLNQLGNVIIVNKALWKNDGRLKFNNKHTAGASFFFNSSPNAREVEVVSLDKELKRHNINRVNFIKMDVEGSETHAMEGAIDTLMANKVNLAIASYHIVNGEETCAAVESTLRRLGYETWTEFPQHKTTYGYKI